MKNLTLIASACLLLSACHTSNIAHQYQPTPTPDLEGFWAGTGGFQTQHLMIRKDGTGEMCWQIQGEYKSETLTISGDKFVTVGAGTLKRNTDGSISNCMYGACMTFNRIKHPPAACKPYFQDIE